eukprot:jgi/Tetstr1/458280/TSEL_044766.t1
MPRLSGDGPRDLLRLRQLPNGFVRPWRRLLTGADGLIEDLRRLRSSTTDTYRCNMRDYCSFYFTARGATPAPPRRHPGPPAWLHLPFHKRPRSLALSTTAGRLAAISDLHRRQLPHLRLAGRPTLYPCKDESIGALVAVLERRIMRPAKRRLPLRIPDLLRITLRGPRAFQLSVVRVLFNAELRCRNIRLRVDVDKRVDARHECFAYIPDHTFHTPYSGFNSAFKAAYVRAFPNTATRTTPRLDRVGSHSGRKSLAQRLCDRYRPAGVIVHVGHWACRKDALDAYYVKTSATEILRLIAAL